MNNIMFYKGYWAEIKYSDEDECFYGSIEGLKNDYISFEGKSVKELKKDFKDAIDEHLQMCKDTNTDPERQCKGSLNVRLGTELHTKAKMKSIEEHMGGRSATRRSVPIKGTRPGSGCALFSWQRF